MDLPAGKAVTVQLAGNSAFTNVGQSGAGVVWPGGAYGGGKGLLKQDLLNIEQAARKALRTRVSKTMAHTGPRGGRRKCVNYFTRL